MTLDLASVNYLKQFGDNPDTRALLIEDAHTFAKCLGHVDITRDIEKLCHDELMAVFIGLQSLVDLRVDRYHHKQKKALHRRQETKEGQPH